MAKKRLEVKELVPLLPHAMQTKNIRAVDHNRKTLNVVLIAKNGTGPSISVKKLRTNSCDVLISTIISAKLYSSISNKMVIKKRFTAIYASAADWALSYLDRSLRPNPNGSQYMKFATVGKGSRTDHVR